MIQCASRAKLSSQCLGLCRFPCDHAWDLHVPSTIDATSHPFRASPSTIIERLSLLAHAFAMIGSISACACCAVPVGTPLASSAGSIPASIALHTISVKRSGRPGETGLFRCPLDKWRATLINGARSICDVLARGALHKVRRIRGTLDGDLIRFESPYLKC